MFVIQPGLEAAVVHQVDRTAEHELDQLLELDEPERRRPLGRLDQQVNVRVLPRVAARDRTKDGEPRVPRLFGAVFKADRAEPRSTALSPAACWPA
jgi:hypothetical protein